MKKSTILGAAALSAALVLAPAGLAFAGGGHDKPTCEHKHSCPTPEPTPTETVPPEEPTPTPTPPSNPTPEPTPSLPEPTPTPTATVPVPPAPPAPPVPPAPPAAPPNELAVTGVDPVMTTVLISGAIVLIATGAAAARRARKS